MQEHYLESMNRTLNEIEDNTRRTNHILMTLIKAFIMDAEISPDIDTSGRKAVKMIRDELGLKRS